jgi:hypothetical protein
MFCSICQNDVDESRSCLNVAAAGGTVAASSFRESTMNLRLLLLATLTVGCRAATDKSPTTDDDADSQSVNSEAQEDSGEAWYDYDEDGGSGDGGSGDDDDGKEDDGKEGDGKEDDGKEDGGDEVDYELEPCADDFDPDEPCEGTWDTGAMCYEGETVWYCEGGEWTNK